MANDKPVYLQFDPRGKATLGAVIGAGVVEASGVADFGRELDRYIEGHPGVDLLLDFDRVEYMSSSTLTELIRAKELTEAHGGHLGICRLRDDVRRVFKVTNLIEHLNVIEDDDVDNAIEQFTRAIESG